MRSPLALFVLLAGFASFVTPWPILRRLVTPNAFMGSGIEEWGAMWGWVGALALLASLTARHDAWMGAMVGWLALTPLLFDQWRAEIVLVAIVALGVVMSAPATERQRSLVLTTLASLGFVQAVYVLVQAAGYDPLWRGLHRIPGELPGGTFSHSGTAGAFLAMTGLVAPAWMLLVIAPAVVATRSRGAVLALLVGLAVRYTPSWGMLAAGAVVAVVLALALQHVPGDPLRSLKLRAAVQGQALAHMLRTSPLVGLGFARWNESKHVVTIPSEINGRDATLNPLHNDLAQWIVETGLGGAVLLGGALCALARRLVAAPRSAVTPALAGACILTLFWYPLHAMPTGAVVATLLGCTTPLPTQGA